MVVASGAKMEHPSAPPLVSVLSTVISPEGWVYGVSVFSGGCTDGLDFPRS